MSVPWGRRGLGFRRTGGLGRMESSDGSVAMMEGGELGRIFAPDLSRTSLDMK
jgi:hypothetical protein